MRSYNDRELNRKIDAFLAKKLVASYVGRHKIDVTEEENEERFSPYTVRFLKNGLPRLTTKLV